MPALIIPVYGPLQYWPISASYRQKATHIMPTKSGMIGILGAALGRERDESLSDLAAMPMHIRIDQPGSTLHDFQTAENPSRANLFSDGAFIITHREYLENAAFTVCFEAKTNVLEEIHQALAKPVYPPYFGRRCCIPSLPLHHPKGLSQKSAAEALKEWPDFSESGPKKQAYFEDKNGAYVIRDQPNQRQSWHDRFIQPNQIEVKND